MTNTTVTSSFRDPSGFVYFKDDHIYRQINFSYKENYDLLMSSGLYNALVSSNLLISHEEIESSHKELENFYKIIKPEFIRFISYPYEWCFS